MTMHLIPRGQGMSWRTTLDAVPSIALSRWGLPTIAAAAIGGGLATNWSWLIAVGAAPFIVGLLPCAAMCALGICMPMIMGGARTKAPLLIDATANGSPPPSQLAAPPRGEQRHD